MAGKKITDVTKLNKGTSRDQWGTLNYFGYKTGDGTVRARLYPDGSFDVKGFDQSMIPRYKSTINWDEAHNIGEGFIDLTSGDKAEKGLLGKDMVDDVNAIIEIHNEKFDEWAGKKCLQPDHNGSYHHTAQEVMGVSVHYSSDGTLETRAQFNDWDFKRTGTTKVEDLKEFSAESQRTVLTEKVVAIRATMAVQNKKVNDLLDAFENGKPVPTDFDAWGASQGAPRNELTAIVQGINDIEHEKLKKAEAEEAEKAEDLALALSITEAVETY